MKTDLQQKGRNVSIPSGKLETHGYGTSFRLISPDSPPPIAEKEETRLPLSLLQNELQVREEIYGTGTLHTHKKNK